MRRDSSVRMKTAAQPTAPASVGVAMPIRITPSVAMITTITGTTPITRSLTTASIEVARIFRRQRGAQRRIQPAAHQAPDGEDGRQ
jgi:hypothetical protein